MALQLRKYVPSITQIRYFSNTVKSPNEDISPEFVNRNPRNLEKMRIGYKPDGYHVEKPGKYNYWHKLQLTITSKYVTATINHFENGEVLRASTSEWGIKNYLYRTKDTAAFINLGRVLGHRCLQTGLTEVSSDIEPPKEDGKVAQFLKALEESGVQLKEPPQYKHPYPWDWKRPEKLWEVIE
ncbi:large ribosomal subunit protein uL18m [Euwallacea similis]|uniref:large ribosomal subunit protein uL18m n=1 Tax=Euwallacea similis TaxID=1736056 RepID=UPI00344D8826